jgi:hypothetical protein
MQPTTQLVVSDCDHTSGEYILATIGTLSQLILSVYRFSTPKEGYAPGLDSALLGIQKIRCLLWFCFHPPL